MTIGSEPTRSIRGKFTNLLMAQVFPLLSSVITTFVTAAVLGVAERGTLALIVSAAGLIGAVAFLSIQVGVVRSYRLGDLSSPRRGGLLVSAIAFAVFVLGSVVALSLPSLQVGQFTAPMLLLVSCGGALVTVNLGILRIRQGLGQSALYRNAWLIQSLVYPVLGIPVAILTRSAYATVLCWFVAIIASTVFVLFHRAPHPSGTTSTHRTPLSRIIGDSAAAHTGVVGQQLMHSADVVVLGFFASATAVGLYSVAVPIAGLIWVVSEALSLLAFDVSGRSTADQAARNLDRLARLNLLFGVVAAVVIAIASFTLLPLILPAYKDAAPLVLLLLPGVVVQGYARIALSSIMAHARRRTLVTIGVVSAALSLLYIPAVMLFGAVGAAAGSTIIYALQTLFVFLIVRRRRTAPEPVAAGEAS